MADSLCGTEDGCRVSVCVSVGVPECAIDTKRAVQRRWGIRPVFFSSQESHMHIALLCEDTKEVTRAKWRSRAKW